MTGSERDAIAVLDARLFGLDGSGEGGAIGRIENRVNRIEATMNRWIGAIALAAFVGGMLGFGGIAWILTNYPTIAHAAAK